MMCAEPDCGGTVVDGYCDVCGTAPAAEQIAHEAQTAKLMPVRVDLVDRLGDGGLFLSTVCLQQAGKPVDAADYAQRSVESLRPFKPT